MLKSGKRAKQKQLTICMLVIFHTVKVASFGKSSGLGVVAILSLVGANNAARKQQFELWHTWIYLAREIVALLSSNKQVLWESCRLLWGQVPPWHWNQGQSTLFMASHLINLDRPQSRMGNRKWWRTIWSVNHDQTFLKEFRCCKSAVLSNFEADAATSPAAKSSVEEFKESMSSLNMSELVPAENLFVIDSDCQMLLYRMQSWWYMIYIYILHIVDPLGTPVHPLCPANVYQPRICLHFFRFVLLISGTYPMSSVPTPPAFCKNC